MFIDLDREVLRWVSRVYPSLSNNSLSMILEDLKSKEGREDLAEGFLSILEGRTQGAIDDWVTHPNLAKEICTLIENFIQFFPESERYQPSLMQLRTCLIKLYDLLVRPLKEAEPDIVRVSRYQRDPVI